MTADDEIREAARLRAILDAVERPDEPTESATMRVAAGPAEPNLAGQRHKPVRRLS